MDGMDMMDDGRWTIAGHARYILVLTPMAHSSSYHPWSIMSIRGQSCASWSIMSIPSIKVHQNDTVTPTLYVSIFSGDVSAPKGHVMLFLRRVLKP